MPEISMICVCRDDGKAEAEALMQEVYRRLGEESSSFTGLPTDASNFLSNVSISLNFDYNAHITSIATDMWHGVSAERYRGGDDVKFYVQCDFVEHGIAALWKAFADLGYPDDVEDSV